MSNAFAPAVKYVGVVVAGVLAYACRYHMRLPVSITISYDMIYMEHMCSAVRGVRPFSALLEGLSALNNAPLELIRWGLSTWLALAGEHRQNSVHCMQPPFCSFVTTYG